jgi:hypothetical protein
VVMNEFTKGGGNRRGLAATDPTLNDRLDELVRTDCSATNVTLAPTDDGALRANIPDDEPAEATRLDSTAW